MGQNRHFILSDARARIVWTSLLLMTVVTVAIARVDLGKINFLVAMIVATVKALLVLLYFMGLKYDHTDNRVIFGGSFVFVMIFFVLTASDLFTRGDVYAKAGDTQTASSAGGGKSRFAQAWVSSPDLITHGKAQFALQCAACHGPEGKGDGPAAAAMNPKPRNFSSDAGWKGGRKPSEVFNSLTKGVGTMPAFGSLPADDRWALVHYLLSLGPKPPADSDADLKKIGVDPSRADGGASGGPKEIPVDLAIEIMAQ